MGYDLPAAIGACIANNHEEIICIAGDGSIMMNIQELQTIITLKLPIKIFILNNDGYHSIRLTQSNLFEKRYVGIGRESGDLSFPDYKKIAEAFGFNYAFIKTTNMLDKLDDILKREGQLICEVFLDKNQAFEPKTATKKMPDGSLYSPPLEDMAPFLPRKELEQNMYYPE